MSSYRSGRGRRRGRGLRLANILTAMMVVLGLLGLGGMVAVYLNPELLPAGLLPTAPPLPTLAGELPTQVAAAQVPTATRLQTATPTSVTVAATWTVAPGTSPGAATATNTRRPIDTPTTIPTLPSRTPTKTPTPTPTDTATPTETPGPVPTFTRAAFPYTRSDDSPFTLRSFTNNNCVILAGEVILLDGNQALPDSLRIHVWDADGRPNGIDVRVSIGSAPAYGQSGWELVVSSAPEQRLFNIQLESVNGSIISSPYQIQTPADCGQNVSYFIFLQNH